MEEGTAVCLDVLRLLNLYNVVGIIEKNNFVEKSYSVSQDQEIGIIKNYKNFLLTIEKLENQGQEKKI